ncbi:hypothetical protein MUO14_15305 [Halobacillus shinanisalinarum]|uniref:Transcriptional regulator n=1 Tax=Halobacillus shinanisalinarum TaxID=2932258 RepID=A0ABY4GV80_9BACI|nr:hypothetical protein [Halobacillus shinanisalinarum]UOQ91876.1 hypothetical protein MUO14_15305 [Halobacillus shinanisalinarum]
MYKIGVVGPGSSVDRMISMAEGFGEDMQFIPYPYVEFQETRQIVSQNDHQVNFWLFSGKLSYMIAKSALDSDEHLIYTQHTESSLYRCFLHKAFFQGTFVDDVSVDELTRNELDEALKQLDLTLGKVFVKTYDIDTKPNDLFNFHLDLWKKGQTNASITCFEGVYQRLKTAGVPVYWYTPSQLEIRQTLRVLAEKVRTFYFKDTQIGVKIIDIEHFDKIKQKARRPYDLQYLELELKKTLIGLCDSLEGSLLEKGNGRYVIFSTRGAIERGIRLLKKDVEQLALNSGTSVAVGIGFGETVFSAEVNGLRAIQQSKEKANSEIIIVQEDGTVIESAGKEDELVYSSLMNDEKILNSIKKANVSFKMYNKIVALVKTKGWDHFTTSDLATHLGLDERNARRIVSSLSDVRLLQYIGEKSLSTRGRPSKLYRLG